MAKGRKTGGRKKGTPNHATHAKAAEVAASGLTPLEFMLQVLRDAEQPLPVRMEASKGAAPYVHPRLANVELSGNKDKPLHVSVLRFTDPAESVATKAVPDAGMERAGTGVPPRRSVPSPKGG